MKSLRKSVCLLLLVLLPALFAACTDFAPTSLSVCEATAPLSPESLPEPCLTINIASQTIHQDPSCRHVLSAEKANLRYAADETDTVNTLFAMGYRFCSVCKK